jgi:hypothetical protein
MILTLNQNIKKNPTLSLNAFKKLSLNQNAKKFPTFNQNCTRILTLKQILKIYNLKPKH